jgi:SagB-type dehydrogenase family enzyme
VTDQEFSDSVSLEAPEAPDSVLAYAESVLKRRSIRAYGSDPYPRQQLMQLLSLLCRPLALGTEPNRIDNSNLTVGFLATRVADFESGFYLLDRADKKCLLVKPGNLNNKMAAVCLDQDWLRQAPLHFLFMSNLDQHEVQMGSRGYRYDLLDAGRMGQRLYMGATAMGDGCCGIGALYDQEARDLLGLNEGSYLLYLVAVGQPSGKQ